ncbi:MAG: hypothetical protein E4H14_00375 [Candidatus Thorarchaeota archaeon]|nr:MAG: hypothetical protein E4H14_00375 [Candidatus Thorarchaeota archaeon]
MIQNRGEYHEKFNGQFYPRLLLPVRNLRRYAETGTLDERELANRFLAVIESAKPNRLISEEKLLDSLSAESVSESFEIWYYLGTGRLLVLWRARTKTLDGAMRVAIHASPDDVVKKTKVQSWMESQKK